MVISCIINVTQINKLYAFGLILPVNQFGICVSIWPVNLANCVFVVSPKKTPFAVQKRFMSQTTPGHFTWTTVPTLLHTDH